MRCLIRLPLLALLTIPLAAHADSAWIIDQVEAGLHESQDIDSPIIKLLPTGSKLEVLARQDDLVQVRDADNDTGWIDAAYLMPEKPARQLLGETQARRAAAEDELRSLRELQNTATTNEVQTLRAARQRLEAELSAERRRVAELRKQINEQQPAATDSTVTTTAWLHSAMQSPRYLIAALAIVLLIGMLLGSWLMDYNNRRRHGGFRV